MPGFGAKPTLLEIVDQLSQVLPQGNGCAGIRRTHGHPNLACAIRDFQLDSLSVGIGNAERNSMGFYLRWLCRRQVIGRRRGPGIFRLRW